MAMHTGTEPGKRVRADPARVEGSPTNNTNTPETVAPTTDNNKTESRFHIRIEIHGHEFNALIDTGATHSYLGAEVIQILHNTDTPIDDTPDRTATMGNGTQVTIEGAVTLPIRLGNITKKINFGLIPNLGSQGIIGNSGLMKFGIQINYGENTWSLRDDPQTHYHMQARPQELPTPLKEYIQIHQTRKIQHQSTQTHTKQAKAAEKLEATKQQTHPKTTERHENKKKTTIKQKPLTPTLPNTNTPPENTLPKDNPQNTQITNQKIIPTNAHTTDDTQTDEETEPQICAGIQELTQSQHTQLQTTIQQKISTLPGQLGLTHLIKHKIDTQGHAPIKQRYYMVSPKIREAIHTEINKMLREDVIEPSDSEWSSPIVMIKKPNNTYRFCLDFRKVNSVSKKDAYPLPYMTAILDKLRTAQYISKIDLSQAYFQIPLDEDSKHITAFTVPGMGLFQFKRMPYGLTGAPATFQRLLDRLIGPECEPYAFAYLDDIIIVTQTFDEHLQRLEQILKRITDAGLTINPEKCEFGCAQVKYLGYIVDRHGLHIDPDKTQPIENYPNPKTIKQLRRLIGMASWYRRFIPNFAHITEPLTRLLKKDQKWHWGEEQENAMNTIKHALTSPPTLACPDYTQTFTLQTDASGTGIGAVLTQSLDDEEHVVAYASRALSEAERKYSTTERECLAVLWSIKKFRPYVEGYHFKVITDHHALKWLRELKNPTGRLARWALELLEYDFDITHRKGTMHDVPDALSRRHEDEEHIETIEDTTDKWYTYKKTQVQTRPEKNESWRIRNKQLYFHRPNPLHSNLLPDTNPWKLVIPKDKITHILHENHDVTQAGHLGIEKTYQRVAKEYYWPGMYRDTVNYIKKCDTCQRIKTIQSRPAGLMGTRIIEEPWTVVASDIMGPLPLSKQKNQYIIVFEDLYTKWVEIIPIRKANAKTVEQTFHSHVISRWGTPRILLTDNGTPYINKLIRELTQKFNIRHATIPPYHAQANPVERVNRTAKTMIQAYVNNDHTEWDIHLQDLQFAINTCTHTSTKHTPAFLNLGRELNPTQCLRNQLENDDEIELQDTDRWTDHLRRLQTLRDEVQRHLIEANEKQAHYYNLRRRDIQFKEGDRVLKKNHTLSSGPERTTAKLSKKFIGPYIITKKISPTIYELTTESGKNIGKCHIEDLKLYT